MLSKEEEEVYLDPPDMESIRQFLSTALKDKEKSNNKSSKMVTNYDQIVSQIKIRDDPEILWKVYVGLSSFVSFFTSKPDVYKDLIQAIYSYDLRLDTKVTVAFVNLLGQIVSSNAIFLAPTFQFLVKLFVLDDTNNINTKIDINFDNDRILRIHKALQTVLALVPISINELYLAIEDNFPHKRFNQETQVDYITQLLYIYDYVPGIQVKILELIISKCLEIDVEIVIEDSGDVKIIEEYSHEEDDLFQLDDEYNNNAMNTTSNNNNTSNISKRHMSFTEDISTIPAAVIESSDKLDAMLVRIITHIDTLLKGNEDMQQRLSQQLLIVFEDRILSTHKSKFVQFILFFSASRSDTFCKMYLQRLLKISLDDKNQSVLKRQYAIGYLASFLSRANFLSFTTVNDILIELISWCSSYVDNNSVSILNSNNDSTSSNTDNTTSSPRSSPTKITNNDNDISKHETFFTFIQACCYILCFYGTEFSMMQMPLKYCWENSVTCSLLPLRYCLQSVKVEFLRLVSHIALFREEIWGLLPQDILLIGKNNDILLNGTKNIQQFSSLKRSTFRMGSGINPLDSFFPFDPCLLSRVHSYIENYYRLWKGVPGLDYDKDDDDEVMVSSVASSVVSSLAYTYETNGMAMSIGGNSVPGESILRALSYQDSTNNKIGHHMKSTNSSDASWDGGGGVGGGDNDAGTESDSGIQQNQGSQNSNIWPLPQRRPRQFSVGSADGW